MRVLIRTLNVFNGNYGGVMQAFALQRVLQDLGHESWTDTSYPQNRLARPKQALFRGLAAIKNDSDTPNDISARENLRLDQFVHSHLQLIDYYGGRTRPKRDNAERFDAFIVGSDQVWRRAYADVPSFLLNAVPVDGRPRVAYAASFGTDNLDDYDARLLSETRVLARKMTAVSVRESSAVKICRDAWGVDAEHVLDPTMLLDVEQYRSLIGDAGEVGSRAPYVYDYTLDHSSGTRDVSSQVASRTGLIRRPALPNAPSGGDPVSRVGQTKPSVESWLAGFLNAECVVTDSFHGMVFSILFRKPFIVAVNQSRGAARFESLLKDLGLELCLNVVGSGAAEVHLPDWDQVEASLSVRRKRSIQFLQQALSGHMGRDHRGLHLPTTAQPEYRLPASDANGE